MPDADTATLLRSLHKELCAHVPHFDAGLKVELASKLLEAVKQGRSSMDELRQVGERALRQTPTMWR